MFPPPQPWKTLTTADPNRTYLAFSSRFALRSFARVPAFVSIANEIRRQLEAAQGVIGYSLAADLVRRNFYTLSVWEDEAKLRDFTRALAHARSMKMFASDMRSPSVFIRWSPKGAELPLAWKDALARHRAETKSSTT